MIRMRQVVLASSCFLLLLLVTPRVTSSDASESVPTSSSVSENGRPEVDVNVQGKEDAAIGILKTNSSSEARAEDALSITAGNDKSPAVLPNGGTGSAGIENVAPTTVEEPVAGKIGPSLPNSSGSDKENDTKDTESSREITESAVTVPAAVIPAGESTVDIVVPHGEGLPPTRSDTVPFEKSQNLGYRNAAGGDDEGVVVGSPTEASFRNNYSVLSPSVSAAVGVSPPITFETMSWLDVFMFQHRGSLWILFNTFFMVTWIVMGAFALYRLLGLPWCSPYLSRTQYLVIHLLIFTAATFEFVQLIHLSYGSHEGLPLFLTLLLTHTPTPCLAVSLIIMMYCIFSSARVPLVGNYSPPLIYVGILVAFVVMLSFVGDIIVGVSRNSIFLIVCRVTLTGVCLACALLYIFNYKRIVNVSIMMRREFRGELKSLALPMAPSDDGQDAKLHLKKMLLTWSRLTLVSCVAGVLMCIFSFCLSLFFTVSFVPLWAFWVLHSSIFVSQLLVVVFLTFGAAFTLTYSNRRNIFYKYFLPSLPSSSSSNGSFIKRGNFIYQRVSMVNGPPLPQIGALAEYDESDPLRNNIIAELASQSYRPKVNLKRSATFNCAPPYGFQPLGTPCSSNLYPVLSDHALAYTNARLNADCNGPDVNDITNADLYCNKPLHISNSFSHAPNTLNKYSHNYGRRYPVRSYHDQDRFSSFSRISKNDESQRRSLAAPLATEETELDAPVATEGGLAGTVEKLSVRHKPPNAVPVPPPRIEEIQSPYGVLRQVPSHSHSFSKSDHYRSPGGRSEPPEKPARRTEPILVKSVLRDNVNALPNRETTEVGSLSRRSVTPSASPSPRSPTGDGSVLHKVPQYGYSLGVTNSPSRSATPSASPTALSPPVDTNLLPSQDKSIASKTSQYGYSLGVTNSPSRSASPAASPLVNANVIPSEDTSASQTVPQYCYSSLGVKSSPLGYRNPVPAPGSYGSITPSSTGRVPTNYASSSRSPVNHSPSLFTPPENSSSTWLMSRFQPRTDERFHSPYYPTYFSPISSDGEPAPKSQSSGGTREKGNDAGVRSTLTDEVARPSEKPVVSINGVDNPDMKRPQPGSLSQPRSPAQPESPAQHGSPATLTHNHDVNGDSSATSGADFETSTLPAPAKRQSLKRNHSTAGDLTPSHKKSGPDDTTSDTELGAVTAPDMNGLKYPWYGTWGGRRRSKKRNSISEEPPSATSSGFNLRRLSASKSSLTSLYEKLKKPKKTSNGKIPHSTTPPHTNSLEGDQDDTDTKDEVEDEDTLEEPEEEEEFLPRLDEDIDLASEILKTSSVLSDFYSLKRSDLKKRKKRREDAAEGDGGVDADEGSEKEEDNDNSDYEDASSLLITNDNDIHSSKSLKVDASDNS